MKGARASRASDLDNLLAAGGGSRSIRELALPDRLEILVAAPHPDDFDAIGLALRHLQARGHELRVAVLTTGASGVDEGFGGATTEADRAALREAEQRASCAFFGLPAQKLEFLRLGGRAAEIAHADADADARAAAGFDSMAPLRDWMADRTADLIFLPHGNDSNRTHRRTFEAVTAVAAELGWPTWACLNQDAKTAQMRVDLYFDFDEAQADWKGKLLRCHRSQQERNLRERGTGFDARVLEVNRRAAQALDLELPYAEVFELMRIGAPRGAG